VGLVAQRRRQGTSVVRHGRSPAAGREQFVTQSALVRHGASHTRDIRVVTLENMRMPEISRARALAYLAAVVAALVVGGHFLIGSDEGEASTPDASSSTLSSHELEEASGGAVAEPPQLVVHVAGAVQQPGLYRLPEGSRVDDAIAAAGGARKRARLDLLNLAAPLVDGQQVLVPGRRNAGDPVAGPPVSGPAPAAPSPVNLNTASLEELDSLPGVGPVTAQKIVDYRSEHGPFGSVDELDAIPGIGPARLEQLRGLVVV
jgi:competence protein ComEA